MIYPPVPCNFAGAYPGAYTMRPYNHAPAFAAAFFGGEFALRQIAQKWKPMEEYSWSMGSLLCYHASEKKKKVYGTEIIRCFFWEFAA